MTSRVALPFLDTPAAVDFVVAKILWDGLLGNVLRPEAVRQGRIAHLEAARVGAEVERPAPCQAAQAGAN